MDEELVEVVVHLQQFRASLQKRDKLPILKSIGDQFIYVSNKIGQANNKDKVGIVNKHLKDLMPKLPLWLPGPTSQEVHGSQPIFEALLTAISDCLPKCSMDHNQETPLKGTMLKERRNFGGEVREDQFADFTLRKRGLHRAAMLDDVPEVCIEIKPYQRQNHVFDECQNEALNQGLSHAGKALAQALELGPGFPAHVMFITGSLVHVSIHKLELTMVGTPYADVCLKNTGILPLLSKEGYQQFVGSDTCHPQGDKHFLGDSCFAGIAAIAKVMRSSHKTLMQFDYPSLQFADVLGSGACGLVLGFPDAEDRVLKLSRYGKMQELEKEVKVLHYLSTGRTSNPNVVSLISHGLWNIPHHGVSVKLPGIILSPRGIPGNLMPDDVPLVGVAGDLLQGIGWLHSKKIDHNDISDSNFVLFKNRAIITDLACAEPLYTKMNNFVGTPDFVHNDIHVRQKNWIARKEYDTAALAHTLCIRGNHGKTPWSPISQPVEQSKLSDRNHKVREWLGKASMFQDDVKTQLLNGVNFCEEGECNSPKTASISFQSVDFNSVFAMGNFESARE